MRIFKNFKKNKGGLWAATLGELIASLSILEKHGFTVDMLRQLREKHGPEKAKKIVAIFSGIETAQPDCKTTVRNKILNCISSGRALTLKPLTGQRTIAKAKKVFKSFIDPDFEKWGLNKPGKATVEIPVQVHEMIKDANFMDIFSSLPGTWEQKWLSQDQIIEFCEVYPDWLRQDGEATFSLCKKDEMKPVDEENPYDNLVVVLVRVSSDGLRAVVRRLGDDSLWRAGRRRRVVAPQLTTLAV